MAIDKNRLVVYLEKTVDLLSKTSHYEWGNSGACNCGHLAQVITGYQKADIHKWSLEKEGDWSDKAEAYCEQSGFKIDDVIGTMLRAGLQLEDIHHIEYLDHPEILSQLADGRRKLERNLKEDVIEYFQAWVRLLKEAGSGIDSEEAEGWLAKRARPSEQVEIYDSVPESEYTSEAI